LVTQIQALRDAVRQARLHAPFRIGACVVLPDRSLARDQDGIRESFARP
jgi:hypothetical protein